MEVRCHFCDEPHFIDDAEVDSDAFHFRCAACETLHLVRSGAVRRVTLPEVRASGWDADTRQPSEPDYRDTLPDIAFEAADTLAPVEGKRRDDDADDRAPTLKMAPIARARPLLGRETLLGAMILLLGLGMVGYAAAGPPPRPLRALASGATFRGVDFASVDAPVPASPAAASAAEPTVRPETTGRARHRTAPRRPARPR